MVGILDYFEFFKALPKDQQIMIGDDKGISGLSKKIFYPDNPDGTPYLPQTRLGKLGMKFDKGVSSKLDQALEFPTQAGKEIGYGVSNLYNYLTGKPQSTIDLEKQTALNYLSPFGKGQKYTPTPFDELREEEDEGLIDSDIQKEINKLTKQTGITKDTTKGATDPNVSSDVAPEDEGLQRITAFWPLECCRNTLRRA